MINAGILYAICMIKKSYVVHIRSFKKALNHGLILKKVHQVMRFNQEAWLERYIHMSAELRKQAKNNFAKDFFIYN